MKFISKRVAIGDSDDAKNEKHLRLSGITAILNVAFDLESEPTQLVSRKAGLISGPGNTTNMIQEAVDTAVKLLEVHDRILIYGHNGVTRAPLVGAAVRTKIGNAFDFLTEPKRITNFESSIHFIQSKTEISFPSNTVENALLSAFGQWEHLNNFGLKKVSIVMPFYDRLDLSRRCVESIRETTQYTPYEIIAVDDGSPHNKNIEAFMEENVDFVIRHSENRGVAAARNSGMEYASGDYICQIDNDVSFFYGWLTKMLESLLCGATLVSPLFTCNMEYFAENRHYMTNYPDENFPRWMFLTEEISTMCMLFEKSLVEDIGVFDKDLCNLWEDKDFCMRLKKYNPDAIIGIDTRVALYHHGHVDPQTGEWTLDEQKHTRSMAEIQSDERDFRSMSIMKERWGAEHKYYASLAEKFGDSDDEKNNDG